MYNFLTHQYGYTMKQFLPIFLTAILPFYEILSHADFSLPQMGTFYHTMNMILVFLLQKEFYTG